MNSRSDLYITTTLTPHVAISRLLHLSHRLFPSVNREINQTLFTSTISENQKISRILQRVYFTLIYIWAKSVWDQGNKTVSGNAEQSDGSVLKCLCCCGAGMKNRVPLISSTRWNEENGPAPILDSAGPYQYNLKEPMMFLVLIHMQRPERPAPPLVRPPDCPHCYSMAREHPITPVNGKKYTTLGNGTEAVRALTPTSTTPFLSSGLVTPP